MVTVLAAMSLLLAARGTRPSRTGEEVDLLPSAELVHAADLVPMESTWAFWADPAGPPRDWPPVSSPPAAVPSVDELLAVEGPTTHRVVELTSEDGIRAAGRWWGQASAPFHAWGRAHHLTVADEMARKVRALVRARKPAPTRTVLVLPDGAEAPGGEPLNTLYFQRTFTVDTPESWSALQLESSFSGGVVIYLNGAEVARYNVEPGGDVHGAEASPFWLPEPVNQLAYNKWRRSWLGVDPGLLRTGENVVAAEVHRRPDEVDLPLYFDLRLSGYEDAGMIRSPYLQSVTPTAITVVWETNVPTYGQLEYGELGSRTRYLVRSPTPADTHHEVVLEGLKPDTEYVYRALAHPVPMGAAGDLAPRFASRQRTFRTTPEEEDSFSFLAYGDSRSQEGVHSQLIELMWEEVQLYDARFVLNTGDLVTHGSPWEQWQEDFFEPALPLMGYVPFYPVLGNHELNHESYYANFALPENESWYRFSYGDAEFFALNTNADFHEKSDQMAWLLKALESSQANWKIVFFHHPPFSCTPSRKPGDKRVRRWLVPVLEDLGADLVLLGHDHLYGRSRDVNGVRYVITGGGGAWTYPAAPDSINEVCVRQYHYIRFDVYPDAIEWVAVDLEGEILDEFVLSK